MPNPDTEKKSETSNFSNALSLLPLKKEIEDLKDEMKYSNWEKSEKHLLGTEVKISKSGKIDINLIAGAFLNFIPYAYPTLTKSKIDRQDNGENQLTFDYLYNRISSLGEKSSSYTKIEETEVRIISLRTNLQKVEIDYNGTQPNKKIIIGVIDGKKQIVVETEGQNNVLQLQQQKGGWIVGTTDGIRSEISDEEISDSIFKILNDRLDYVEEKIDEGKQKTDTYLQSLAYQEEKEKNGAEDILEKIA